MVKIINTSVLLIFQACSLFTLTKTLNAHTKEINGIVNNTKGISFKFDSADFSFHENMKVKVWTSVIEESQNQTEDYPLMFTVRQRNAVTSWQLPVVREGNIISFQTGRILCFEIDHMHMEKHIQIDVFTQSSENLKFQLKVTATPDYTVKANTSIVMNLSMLSANFYFFDHKPTELTLINITSNTSDCMVVSLQTPSCPVYVSESEVQYHGRWITVTKAAAITVQINEFPNGFYLVFVPLKTDDQCEQYQGIGPSNSRNRFLNLSSGLRSKMVEFKITTLKENSTILALILPLLIYCGVISVIIIVFSYFHQIKHSIVILNTMDNSSCDLLLTRNNKSVLQRLKEKLKSPVRITDIIKRNACRLEQKSQRFYWAIILISVFYTLPVFQLAFLYLKVIERTGDEDLCYFNFLCSHSYGFLKDFNHVYSNIGYVIFGVIFIGLVRIKQSRLRNLEKACISEDRFRDELEMNEFHSMDSLISEDAPERISQKTTSSIWTRVFPDIIKSKECGVFYHFGLFYAMGIALTLQGILSGAYHICPTQMNFQFDASFMYVLVIFTIVKLYQFRHPIYFNANITFVSLALIAIWAYIGLEVNNHSALKGAFSVFHLLCIFNLLLYQYYVGYLRIKNEVATNIFQVYGYFFAKLKHFCEKGELKTFRRLTVLRNSNGQLQVQDYTSNRSLLPALAIVFNLLVTVMNFTKLANLDFPSQVLGILIVNSLVYLVYYILMKFIHNEYKGRMWLQTSIYSALTICFCIPSLMYFSMKLMSWEGAPAESRERNQDCFLLNFYDYHDVWHFLSAPSMFFFFLVLLTIDDDLIATPKSDIAVF